MAEWVRNRPWPVWAAAGSVFVLFALLGAVTHRPAMAPMAGPGLAEAFEHGTGEGGAKPAGPAGTPDDHLSGPDRPQVAAPRLSSTPTPAPSTAAFYPNCTAARAAGVAPIPRGKPGYRAALDEDNDGFACDTTSAGSTPTPAGPTPTVSGTGVPVNPLPTPTESTAPVDPTPTPTDPVPPTEPAPEPTGVVQPGSN